MEKKRQMHIHKPAHAHKCGQTDMYMQWWGIMRACQRCRLFLLHSFIETHFPHFHFYGGSFCFSFHIPHNVFAAGTTTISEQFTFSGDRDTCQTQLWAELSNLPIFVSNQTHIPHDSLLLESWKQKTFKEAYHGKIVAVFFSVVESILGVLSDHLLQSSDMTQPCQFVWAGLGSFSPGYCDIKDHDHNKMRNFLYLGSG